VAAPALVEGDEEAETDEDSGASCSVWLMQSKANRRPHIPEDLLSAPWAGLMDKVQTMDGGQITRACRKGAKQVATLGPASGSEEMIERLFLCGVDVFRLNFSHGSHEEKVELIGRIRSVEERYQHPIGILADLQGPKQRCGRFADEDGIVLRAGQQFRFDLDDAPGDDNRVQLPHPEILLALREGKTLLLDDGKLRMRVIRQGYIWEGKDVVVEGGAERPSSSITDCPPFIECEVEVGGKLSSKKGVNTPDVVLPISPITEKDRKDIEFICGQDIDWVGLSFVQRHEDMAELRELIKCCEGNSPKILAKIEKPSALEDLDMILQESDGAMVARGDLGVETPPEEVPFHQKDMIMKARRLGKPVIVATQMLESMISCPTPTRAECSDVANAIIDGCDAVMLSGEAAVGKYPAECVEMQRRVIAKSECFHDLWGRAVSPNKGFTEDHLHNEQNLAILASAAELAKGTKAKAIICFTNTGQSVQQLVQLRPGVPILAVCNCLETARWLTLLHGVYTTSDVHAKELAARVEAEGPYAVRFAEAMEVACDIARMLGLALRKEDKLVLVGRLPLFKPGPLNSLRLTTAMGPLATDGYGFKDMGEE
jgi:pyruvate kinase